MTVFANTTLGISDAGDIYIGCSLIISMSISLVINPIVILYHLKKRTSEARLLFTLLGISDFVTLFLIPLVNIVSFLEPAPDHITHHPPWYQVMFTWTSEITVQYSAFLTAVLSLTRYISIAYPFYLINIPLLRTTVVLWFIYLLGFRVVTKWVESRKFGCQFVWDPFAQLVVPHVNCPKVSEFSYKLIYIVNATVLQRVVWIVISLFSLTFTVTKLHQLKSKISKRSEITIVILTTAYLLAFIPMIIENVFWLSNSYLLADNGYYFYYIMVTYPGQILSAINPIIIIIRSRDFQRFLKGYLISWLSRGTRNSQLAADSGCRTSPLSDHKQLGAGRRLTPAPTHLRSRTDAPVRASPVPLRKMHSYPPIDSRLHLLPPSRHHCSSFSELSEQPPLTPLSGSSMIGLLETVPEAVSQLGTVPKAVSQLGTVPVAVSQLGTLSERSVCLSNPCSQIEEVSVAMRTASAAVSGV